MLGRQQITGIPTAISELFKNSHDAYADLAVADFFRSQSLFVIRDDGIGMSREEFEKRWLMLGTESKVEAKGVDRPPARIGAGKRPVLGEKGIGRLAIAAIGPQVLVMSRPLNGESLGDVVVAFINWGVFELVSADLDQVEIPILELPGGELPSKKHVDKLIGQVEANVVDIRGPGDTKTVKRIQSELKEFRELSLDPLEHALGSPGLRDGSGTHFFIKPASPNLSADLEGAPGPRAAAGTATEDAPRIQQHDDAWTFRARAANGVP